MNQTIDQEDKNNVQTASIEKAAFTSILLALVFTFLKFFRYVYTTVYMLDSQLIPTYTINYSLKDSFFSGLILSLGVIITFYLYKLKKYQIVLILNAIFIVQCFVLPLILQVAST